MRILAIDTALNACSVAVLEAGESAPLAFASVAMEKGHAEALLPIVKKLMEGLDGGFPSLGRVAVTVGPGSFTGIRVGLSAARAMGLALKVPVVGVSTLSAYAAPLIADVVGEVVAVAIDARHGNVFFQAFAPGGRTLVSPRVTTLKEAARAIGAGSVRLAGSAAAALAIECWGMGLKAQVADGVGSPDIFWVARLGLAADPQAAAPKPLYLRPPNATPQIAGRLARV
ncbi:MAG: tRNA (adenosine(37)-N6)-threonylcarbamoyltransferase complex dimerization subunit type 1 TsaB [Beijerinckiaceae bacterium]|nr:tRNA (adenosine(37)-N6)-threonylcarbamoyltransferase complex dimerization subunit type 1 TsaB [Beijerinckiaceae bacterium]